MSNADRIGVIGLGIMGGAIVRHLLKSGRHVVGYDVDPARAQDLTGPGFTAAASAADVAQSCRAILTSLPSDAALEQTSAALSKPGVVVAELSTLSMPAKEQARRQLAAAGATLLDCPISGTGAQAAAGNVVVFVSGDKTAAEKLAPVFAAFAKSAPYVGDFGAGMKLKLIANLLVAIHNVSTAEAINLGRRAGLDLDMLIKVIGPGAGGSRMLDVRGPLMVKGAYEPATMKLDVWQKDMDLIAEFSRAMAAATPLFDATRTLYAEATRLGGGRDTAAVHDVLATQKVAR